MHSLTIFLALLVMPASGMSLARARYSQIFDGLFKNSKVSGAVVYIGSEVKAPGAYKFKKGMTAADLVQLAGGLTRAASAYAGQTEPQLPKVIDILRPTKKDPDPTKPVHRCKLDWKLTDGGASKCTFPLKKNDLLLASTMDMGDA